MRREDEIHTIPSFLGSQCFILANFPSATFWKIRRRQIRWEDSYNTSYLFTRYYQKDE